MTIRLHPISCMFISLILCLLLQGCSKQGAASKPSAPDFTLQDLAGNEVSLRQYRGKIVLLDFWATSCPPCRKSIPELVDVQEKYRDQGLIILGISTDDPRRVSDKSLLGFKKRYRINYSILRADYGVTLDYFGTRNMAIPTLFVIDQKGKVVDRIVGHIPGAAERSVKKLL
jgi:cytochrome c biogenesis protein CcmG/thiol:disulfide interchange protein DsbE